MRLGEKELVALGRSFGAEVGATGVVTLAGPLGAGKSTFARAVVQGAGVEDTVPSPTFNLLFRYPTADGREIVHIDLYRIEHPDELDALGWDELGGENELVLVEWPDRAGGRLPRDRWDMRLDFVPGDPATRELTIERAGAAPDLPFPNALRGLSES